MSQPSQRHLLELEAASDLGPLVRGLVFRVSDGPPLVHRAGQWIKLYLADGIDRDYSIASAPGALPGGSFELAVTRVDGGPGSAILHDLPIGARLEAGGPFGFFEREPSHRDAPALFVGTGTGLAPLRAMIWEELTAAPDDGPPLALLFGCRHEADILWRDELEAMASAHPRFRYEVTLSRPPAGWAGRSGYVQEHLDELLPSGAHAYICGLSRMVKDVRSRLKADHGLDRRRIHTERYD